MPEQIELSQEFHNAFERVGMGKEAMQKFVRALLTEATEKQIALIAEERALWTQVCEVYGLDLLADAYKIETNQGKSVLVKLEAAPE